MIGLRITIISAVISSAIGLKEPRPDDGAQYEDEHLHPMAIVAKYGYPAENHTVTTADGYELALHRIPYGKLSPKNESKGVLLLQHGLLCSSTDFIIMGTKRGLAYILADEGYDVWLPNSRGNTYSRKNDKYSPEQKKFWDFSWHEMGIYDLPASIDYILNQTNQKQLYYLGHSQGTTSFLVMTSLLKNYNDKIKIAVLMAPIAYLAHSTNKFLHVVARTEAVSGAVVRALTPGEFLPHNDFIEEIAGDACNISTPITSKICENEMYQIFGFDAEQLNDTMVSIIAGHTPAGASVKEVQHYGQSLNINKFRQYDYGSVVNDQKYKQLEPPDYPLENITAPTVIIWASGDKLADEQDVDQLTVRINHTLKEKYLITYANWSHLDYMYAKEIIAYLAEPLVDILNKY